jgi:hypothetical protein
MKVTTVGIDLAKNVFQLHGVNEYGKTVIKKQIRRDQMAKHPGCSNGESLAGVGSPEEKTQISAYLTKLVFNYEMVSKLNPVFSDGKNRNARYYIADNFLQAWLTVAKPAREAARLKP